MHQRHSSVWTFVRLLGRRRAHPLTELDHQLGGNNGRIRSSRARSGSRDSAVFDHATHARVKLEAAADFDPATDVGGGLRGWLKLHQVSAAVAEQEGRAPVAGPFLAP